MMKDSETLQVGASRYGYISFHEQSLINQGFVANKRKVIKTESVYDSVSINIKSFFSLLFFSLFLDSVHRKI